MKILKKGSIALILALVVCGAAFSGSEKDAELAKARSNANRAANLMAAYYNQVILYRKTPTQTHDARTLRREAWRNAEAAVRILDALREKGGDYSIPVFHLNQLIALAQGAEAKKVARMSKTPRQSVITAIQGDGQ